MKKILFVIPAYNHGGTNKSLVNMLECLNEEKYNIDIFCMADSGPYKSILSKFNVIKHSRLLTAIFQKYNSIITERYYNILWKLVIKVIYRFFKFIFNDSVTDFIYKKIARRIDRYKYDTVIAMQEGPATAFVQFVNADNKIAWVRCDYTYYRKLINANEIDIYDKFTKIICVSKYTKSTFVNFYPTLNERCFAIYDVYSLKSINDMAGMVVDIDKRFANCTFTIISIGRLSPVKQFDIIPLIAKELIINGFDFNWYIIGDGEERESISNLIKENDVSKQVILLGQKDNPYPYIAKCDVLVCTSISEAFPNVINEAKILHKPVITTNFCSAKELIDNNLNGYIIEEENIAKVLVEAINDDIRYREINKNAKAYVFSQEKTIEVIKTIF